MSVENVTKTKRLLADIPEDAFWIIKEKTVRHRLTMKEMIPLAVSQFLGLDLTPEQLGLEDEVSEKVVSLSEGGSSDAVDDGRENSTESTSEAQ